MNEPLILNSQGGMQAGKIRSILVSVEGDGGNHLPISASFPDPAGHTRGADVAGQKNQRQAGNVAPARRGSAGERMIGGDGEVQTLFEQ